MVCFKRKPVQYVPLPDIANDETEVWVIPETQEVFTTYESYLKRMDYYKQTKFACEVSGRSGMTFFDALRSEKIGSRDVDLAFPDPLKEPVLRKVQFSTVSRIDNLVDYIYDEFKQDFYPREHVIVRLVDGERLAGTVREKAKFPELRQPDGTLIRPADCRYFVALNNMPGQEAIVDDAHIMRDRRSFTKLMIRSFIRNNVTREPWTGAPWIVKEHVAEQMRIDTNVPVHLRHGHKVAERKAQQQWKKESETLLNFVLNPPRGPELKPVAKAPKSKLQQIARHKQQQFLEYQQALAHQDGRLGGHFDSTSSGLPILAPHPAKVPPKPAPPPPIKYPTEDLDIQLSRDGTHRPLLTYLSRDTPVAGQASSGEDDILMESVGPLLETWNTLNVFCQVFYLDSFTFDDYLEALRLGPISLDCELFVEIHCAVLKTLVDDESNGGNVQVNLPELPKSGATEEQPSGDDVSTVITATPEPVPKPTTRVTRSSLAKSEAAALNEALYSTREASVGVTSHRASEVLAEYGWVDRLRKRDFKDGGWEVIVLGLLNQLALKPQHAKSCHEILANLAPVHLAPTQETVQSQYCNLDINSRVKVLQMLCMLTLETKAIRGYIEESNEVMTEIRKERVEWQRSRKAAMEELRALDEERKTLAAESQPTAPDSGMDENGKPRMTGKENGDEGGEDDESLEAHEDANQEEMRELRTGRVHGGGRKRKRGHDHGRKKKGGGATKASRPVTKMQKLLDAIEAKKQKIRECEEQVAVQDSDLREADTPRTRCLGKDRFWNRYWFLERNAMPYGGLPDSSTADAGYANGCLWVQGPDDLERCGFIELSGEEDRDYRRKFQMTVLERKRLEEGPTSVFTAREWGYYDDPDSLDMLIGWLDVRGNRELKLKKELQSYRAKIADNMEKRKDYVNGKEQTKPGDECATRMSTRIKGNLDHTSPRCMSWRNTMALQELGHLHSEQPKARKNARKTDLKKDTAESMTNRQGKPLGRQGTRYNF